MAALSRYGALLAAASLAACSAQPGAAGGSASGGLTLHPVPPDQQVPDYAKKPYEPFSRENALAIALREWRAWGMFVNDSPPGRDGPASQRSDRQPGMWQRVGDYWWVGQNALSPSSGWTGKYGDFGVPYVGEPPAWSAAFISYVMRVAGAGDRFPYSTLHATYINAAASGNPILTAQPADAYPPIAGDLICYGRRGAERLRFTDLPTSSFYGHCDVVIDASPGQLTVIGGNVTAGVTLKHVPTAPSGLLVSPDGRTVDSRYPWFVVLQVHYDQPDITSPLPIPRPFPDASVPAETFPVADPEPAPAPPPAKPPRKVRRGR